MYFKENVLLMLVVLLAFACETKENREDEYLSRISALEAREAALQTEVHEKDSAMMSFMSSIAEIERNLKEIRAREMNIELTQQEEDLSPEDLRSQIGQDIAVIDELIGKNKRTINTLGVRLRQSNDKNKELASAMEALEKDLTQKIEEKEYNITLLKDRLDETQSTVKSLLADVDSLVRSNDEKTVKLNTAYFVAGDYEKLKNEQILDKEGGFLGILGRTEAVRDDFNREKFQRIDIREKQTFWVRGKDIKLVTIHPPESYKIEKEKDSEEINLVVSNPERFWESSKYLVMMVE